MAHSPNTKRGRGIAENPTGRFEQLAYEPEACSEEIEAISPQTQFLKDSARSIISSNDSPDLPFDAGLNPYRGCEHGCSYCYARPYHEYLGFSAGLDFETRILVKEDAPELLRKALSSPTWAPQVLSMSGVTDCYQPIEKQLRLTRQCLEVLLAYRNPVGVITKNQLVTRDVDLLSALAKHKAVCVGLSITTLDPDLARRMEPRTSSPNRRLDAIRTLSDAGIPTGVMVAPVIPGLTDHEIPAIVSAAAQAGALCASFTAVRLPGNVAPLFETWLETHFPDRRDKVMNRIRDLHGGRTQSSEFGTRLRGQGQIAEQIKSLFDLACKKSGLVYPLPKLSTAAFRRPGPVQHTLFE